MQALRPFGAVFVASVLLAAAPAPAPLLGFTAPASGREAAAEARFLDLPSAQGALDDANAIGAHPHYAGTPGDRALAEWSRDLLREYGFDARLEAFTARVDTPRTLTLELYADGRRYVPRNGLHRARGTPPIGFDLREAGDANDPPTLDPAVGLPFNAGSADGDVVAPLVYAHRGMPEDYEQLAQAGVDVRGAVVLVRYGAAFRGLLAQYAQRAGAVGAILYDDPADKGPWRSMQAVQRGSLGEGIRIPVLPISAGNAQTLLRALRGRTADGAWSGALDAPYPLGKGPAYVHLAVQLNRTTTTLWNTIGVLRGTQPDQSVVMGAHRDAWVAGVGDNGAGTITMLEAARGLGYLARSGWRPKRTLVVALWDGEELGLLGSDAYVRAHAGEVRDGCIAYLNADEDITGPRLAASAAGALQTLVREATNVVPDPARHQQSLRVRWEAQPRGIALQPPGGGSDHVSFLTRFGTPVAELGFSGPFGPYHSSYDTVRYAQTASDPGFVLHRTNAQLYGVLAMRLATADALPYKFAAYVPALRSGLLVLEARAQRDRRAIDLAPLQGAVETFARAARRTDDRVERGDGPGGTAALRAAQTIDGIVYGVHGYDAVAFPGIVDAYDARDAARLRASIAADANALERAASELR